MSTSLTTGTLTFDEAKSFLNKYYGYALKEMRSDAIIRAMFKQEDITATAIFDTDGVTVKEYALSEDYAIKDFNKKIEFVPDPSLEVTNIEGVDLAKFPAEAAKYKIDLALWCYLVKKDNTTLSLADAYNDFYEDDFTPYEFAMLFDKMSILGFIKEETDAIKVYAVKQATPYHNALNYKAHRFAPLEQE